MLAPGPGPQNGAEILKCRCSSQLITIIHLVTAQMYNGPLKSDFQPILADTTAEASPEVT